MKKVITIIIAAIIVFAVGFTIYYLGEKNKEETMKKEDALDIKVNIQQKEIEKTQELTFMIEVKNNNLKEYKKEYDPSCEYVWTMELIKEGTVIERGHGECLGTEKETLKMEQSQTLKYVLIKPIEEPGEYTAIFRTFGKEIKKEFTIKGDTINKE